MRLLVFGHFSHTGFGTVTVELARRFLDAGVDVRVLAVNHRGEPIQGPLAGRIWPASVFGHPFGADISAAAIAGDLWRTLDKRDDWKPDRMLVISDVSGLQAHMGKITPEVLALWRSIPVHHYCPIEGDNLKTIWKQLWTVVSPVAMSDYGQRVISAHVGHHVPRIYHGVDTERFRPVSMMDPVTVEGRTYRTKDQCHDHFLPDRIGRKMILRVDRNATRKFYYKLLQAFVEIARADPLVDLLLHCAPVDVEGNDLESEVMGLPEDIRDDKRVWFTGRHDTFNGLDQEGLVALYNAADVYVSTTGGEGFGLTLAESLACEVPVVVTDWAAEREVVGPGGIMVPPLHDSYGDPVRFHSSYGMDWAVPDAKAFVEPVLSLLAKPSRRRQMGAEGRKHIQRSFSWDTAAAEFLSLFEDAHASVAV